jgi:hypothetical protein
MSLNLKRSSPMTKCHNVVSIAYHAVRPAIPDKVSSRIVPDVAIRVCKSIGMVSDFLITIMISFSTHNSTVK